MMPDRECPRGRLCILHGMRARKADAFKAEAAAAAKQISAAYHSCQRGLAGVDPHSICIRRWVLTPCPTAPPARATTKCASSWGESFAA